MDPGDGRDHRPGDAADDAGAPGGATLRVRGIVQGVGFRPFVWRLARRHGIDGEVRNDGEGVLVHASGPATRLDAFIAALRCEAPPLARVAAVERAALAAPVMAGFRIVASSGGETLTGIAADAAVCVACMTEVLDPGDRRYRYPFANCTGCGSKVASSIW